MSEYKIPGEYVYDGMTLSKYLPAEIIEKLKCLELKEGDILMDAYPKSGSRYCFVINNNYIFNRFKSFSQIFNH